MPAPELTLKEILYTCFDRYDGRYASGEPANNKIDLEKIQPGSDLWDRMIGALVGRIEQEIEVRGFDPGFAVGIPNGATPMAEAVAVRLGIAHVLLRKDEAKNIWLPQDQTGRLSDELSGKTGIVVEDITNRLTNVKKTLAIPSLAGRICLIASVLDRGDPDTRQLPKLTLPGQNPDTAQPIPFVSVIEHYIPPMLDPDSDLWRYA